MKHGKLETGRCAQLPAKAAAKTKAVLNRGGKATGALGNTYTRSPGAHANLKGGTAAAAAK